MWRGDARALLGDRLLGDLDQNLLPRLEQVADDGHVRGLHGAAGRTSAAIALGALRTASAASAHAAIAELPRLSLTFAGDCRLEFAGRLVLIIFFVVFFVVLAGLAVEVQLDAMVEVRLLEHFAQVAGAHLGRQRLLFVILKVLFLGLAVMMMTGSVELLLFDEFFFDEAAAGSIG